MPGFTAFLAQQAAANPHCQFIYDVAARRVVFLNAVAAQRLSAG